MAGTDRPFGPGPSKRAQPKRQAALQFGLSAESRATACLLLKGYRILARRFKTPVGEIDIVARRRSTLVFVEVKARKNLDDAAEALTARQQARIRSMRIVVGRGEHLYLTACSLVAASMMPRRRISTSLE